MERPSGKLERFAILGRAILGVIEKLITYPNDDNLQCAIRVLKVSLKVIKVFGDNGLIFADMHFS